MGISTGTAIAEPQTETRVPAATLARFLSSLASDGLCFCCSSPADLMVDGGGAILLRCAACGAEMTAEETTFAEKGNSALRAA
jgi:hypothetical protein